jgi:hypothetical protein
MNFSQCEEKLGTDKFGASSVFAAIKTMTAKVWQQFSTKPV